MADTLDLSIYVKRQDDGTAHLDLAVEGIDCAACIDEIEGGLCQLPGIVDARLNYTNHRLAVEWRDGAVSPARVVEELQRLGYRAHPFRSRLVEEEEDRRAKWLLKCLAVAGFASMNIMLLAVSVWSGNVTDITPETRDFFHWLAALIALPAVAYAGQPFFQSAMNALRNRRTNMDVPIVIGILLRFERVGGRDDQLRRAHLFRLGRHAALLPAVRPLSRSGHAAEDPRSREQSRLVQGRSRAQDRGERRDRPCPYRCPEKRATGFSSARASASPSMASSCPARRRSTRAS